MWELLEQQICDKLKNVTQILGAIKAHTNKTYYFQLCTVVLLCLAGYQHALSGNFVFDDVVAIVKNQDVTTLPLNLSAVFVHDFWGAPLKDKDSHKSYRPLTTLMFHMEYAYLNLHSKHMKLINLFLHCVNTCLLWKLISGDTMQFLNTVGGKKEIATIAASLFAVHPVHTEAVCGVVGRAELLFCLCYLCALLLVSTKINDTKIIVAGDFLIVGIAFIALLFKESAITILPACIFFDFVRQNQLVSGTYFRQLHYLLTWKYAFWIGSSLVMLYWRLWLQDFESPRFKPMDNPIAHSDNLWTKLLSQNFLYALNFWILLCPQWLSFDWALGCVELIEGLGDLRVWSIFALYTLVCIILWNYRSKSSIFLGFGLIVIPYLPACGIIKVGFVIAERTLYVPSIGFCLLVAYSYVNLKNSIRISSLNLLHKSLLLLVFACFLLRTRERASEWLTEEKLFTSALAVCPNNAKVHYNIARLATDKFDRRKAFHHYHKAIELYPQYESALMNLGNLYREIGDLETAEKYLKSSLESLPEFPAAWMNLGIVQSARRKHAEALTSYQNALKYRKRYAICHYNIGNLYLDLSKYSEAMHHWQEAVALNPKQPKAWANILTMLDNRGLYEDAVRLSASALEYLPNEPSIMFIRANVFGKMNRYIDAESLYKLVIVKEPTNMLYHTNLGVLYHRWGKLNLAIDSYQQALKLNPKKAKTAHENLSKLLSRRRQEEEATQGG